MLSFTDGLILHHGSYCEVKEPDLALERKINEPNKQLHAGRRTASCIK